MTTPEQIAGLTEAMLADGWIEWDGGGLEWGDSIAPVHRDAWITVKFRGAAKPEFGVLREYGHARQFAWWHDDTEDDIIAFKPEQPQ